MDNIALEVRFRDTIKHLASCCIGGGGGGGGINQCMILIPRTKDYWHYILIDCPKKQIEHEGKCMKGWDDGCEVGGRW